MIVKLTDGRLAYTDGKAFAFVLEGLDENALAILLAELTFPDPSPAEITSTTQTGTDSLN